MPDSSKARNRSLDALRGIVMILMALDHVRDLLHHDASLYSPTDLTRASALLFMTRWVTHFCLPVFMFCAGVGAKLWLNHGRNTSQLSRFLLTRGLWLMVLEVTVMRVAYNFSFSGRYVWFLLILWGFGVCMVALAGLVWLPARWLLGVSVVGIFLSNCLDFVHGPTRGAPLWIWTVFRQPGFAKIGHTEIVTAYPLVPWLLVMSAGFCFGALMDRPARELRRISALLGIAVCTAFLVFRSWNHYGDPVRWIHTGNTLHTVLSFLNCTKYPGSLDFVLTTLGPALLVFAVLCQLDLHLGNPLIVFGRVPLFYFILHFYLIHVIAVVLDFARYGLPAIAFTFTPLPSMGGDARLFPPSYGVPLWGVYVIWALVLALLYPVCVWFGRLKAQRRYGWLQYL
jgi:uncharacterized membrane protein